MKNWRQYKKKIKSWLKKQSEPSEYIKNYETLHNAPKIKKYSNIEQGQKVDIRGIPHLYLYSQHNEDTWLDLKTNNVVVTNNK